ncbi:hypothetical protein [Stutzerimonas stutzeri]|uniref:Uncharacterized protein n=1 Tax=Stutzerimonas stutzeri TaxID=316 RepID=A0A0D7EBQ3_STUST|nr:hypothetical protein [Stutzerimonas stutzeri]KIZ37002.1 hypothetical protein LO50_07255 [Stutzerimonas stutzeri]
MKTDRLTQATENAAVFLLPPYESETERGDALDGAVELMRQAIEHAVRAGRDDLAFKLLDLVHEVERRDGR